MTSIDAEPTFTAPPEAELPWPYNRALNTDQKRAVLEQIATVEMIRQLCDVPLQPGELSSPRQSQLRWLHIFLAGMQAEGKEGALDALNEASQINDPDMVNAAMEVISCLNFRDGSNLSNGFDSAVWIAFEASEEQQKTYLEHHGLSGLHQYIPETAAFVLNQYILPNARNGIDFGALFQNWRSEVIRLCQDIEAELF